MESNDWTDLQDRVFTLHAQGKLREPLETADCAARDFPEKATKTAYWCACSAASSARPGRRLPSSGRPWAAASGGQRALS